MKKLKPDEESPVDRHNQRGQTDYNINSDLLPSAKTPVKGEKQSSSDGIDWETHEDERTMWSLLTPYCLPATRIRRPVPSLQLGPGVVEALIKNGGRLELYHIADAMWNSVQGKARKEARI
jgi:hypothetical protein